MYAHRLCWAHLDNGWHHTQQGDARRLHKLAKWPPLGAAVQQRYRGAIQQGCEEEAGQGWAGNMWLTSLKPQQRVQYSKSLCPLPAAGSLPWSSHLPANTSQGPNIQPMLVGQHTTSPRRTSWWKKALTAHRKGVVCDQGMALGSPAAYGGKKDDNHC